MTPAKTDSYIRGRGGRKTATAITHLFKKEGGLTVNGKDYKAYFKGEKHRAIANEAFQRANASDAYSASVHVTGGGLNAQAEAIRNSVARALAEADQAFRPVLKREGFLTRDARMVERKKYGLRKARRAPQWAKR